MFFLQFANFLTCLPETKHYKNNDKHTNTWEDQEWLAVGSPGLFWWAGWIFKTWEHNALFNQEQVNDRWGTCLPFLDQDGSGPQTWCHPPGEQGAAGCRMLFKQGRAESQQPFLRLRKSQSRVRKLSKEADTRPDVILATDPDVPDTRQQKLCNMYLLFPWRPCLRVIQTDNTERVCLMRWAGKNSAVSVEACSLSQRAVEG